MIVNTANFGGLNVNDVPNNCPLCHHAMEPVQLLGWVTGDQNHVQTELHMGFRCGHRSCQRMFIGIYGGIKQGPRTSGIWELQRLTPKEPVTPRLPIEVTALSPQFVHIFGQAAAAEAYELGEIAGVGYRKALEFLLKDFCASEHQDAAEAIRAKQLGTVIAEYVADTGIKECAKRAAWLGNDETHYVRKWETKDISDLKALIALTVSWIEAHLLTAKYLRDMPPA